MHNELTIEELAAWLDGDVQAQRARQVADHVDGCRACQDSLAALRRADAALHAAGRATPPAGAVLEAWAAVSAELAPASPPEVMTLEQAAAMLAVSPRELGEVMDELPLFEVAGQLRVRRARLVEWIADRERSFSRQRSESWVAHAAAGIGKGVA